MQLLGTDDTVNTLTHAKMRPMQAPLQAQMHPMQVPVRASLRSMQASACCAVHGRPVRITQQAHTA